MKRARYKLLEDGTYFGEIAGCEGVWANAKKLENCRDELRDVLESWKKIHHLKKLQKISGVFS